MSVLQFQTCSGSGTQNEVMESLMLPRVRASSFDSSTYEEWSEETMFQNNQQMSLVLDEMHSSHPSLPYSAEEVRIAKYIDFAKIHQQAPDHYSSFSTCSSTDEETDSCGARARSLTPQRPKKVLHMQIKKPNSCRLPGATTMAASLHSCYPSTPSTIATVNVETPVRGTPPSGPIPACYTYIDQLESTRRRDEGNIWNFPQCQRNATPDSSLLSPLSVFRVSSSQTFSTSVSSESTPTHYQRACRRRMWRRAGASPRQFRFTKHLDLPRWGGEKVSCVPEKAALNTETGYFIGTWQIPNAGGLITIKNDGTVESTDPDFVLSANFLGSRAVEFKLPNGRSKKANLSQDGTEIVFEDGVKWMKMIGEGYSSTEQLNQPGEEDRQDLSRASNICSIRSNFRDKDNDGGEFVDIPVDVPFCPSIEIEDELHLDSANLISGGVARGQFWGNLHSTN